MAFVELTPRVGYVPGGVNIGVIRGDSGCWLIDAGLNDSSARKALRAVRDELSSTLLGILTTHAHADHFGGNAFLVKRTGAQVWAPEIDEAFLRYPILQPATLFAGADPPASMRGPFLLAEASPVDRVLTPGEVLLDGVPATLVSLAGHSPNQIGVLVEGVFFSADVVLPAAALDKYRIPYLFSVTDHRASLLRVRDLDYGAAVPGHGPIVDSLAELLALNTSILDDVEAALLDLLAEPAAAESILTRLLELFGGDPGDAAGFYLLHPTIYAFLSHLERSGNVEHLVRDRRSLWVRRRRSEAWKAPCHR